MSDDFDFITPYGFHTGWVDDQNAVAAVMAELPQPMFGDTELSDIKLEDLPKECNLNKFTKKAIGADVLKVMNQGSTGSCVGFGHSRASEMTNIVEIATGDPEEFKWISRYIVYGGSRVNVNGGRSPFRSDGSVGAWAAKWTTTGGLLDMAKYGQYDLSTYSPSTCREWGSMGVPEELVKLCNEHKVAAATMVTNVDDARRALANGHAIAVCSNQGFSMRRDSNGVCSPSGSWAHCMAIIGYVFIGNDLYFYIENSWSDYLKGSPAPALANDGTFLARADIVNRMLGQKDSFAYAGVSGWKRKGIDWGF